MTGALWATISGIGFGFFQAFNRRAGRAFDAYFSTFILIAISAVILDGAIIGLVPMIAYVMEHAPSLKVVGMHGVGVAKRALGFEMRLLAIRSVCAGREYGRGRFDRERTIV